MYNIFQTDLFAGQLNVSSIIEDNIMSFLGMECIKEKIQLYFKDIHPLDVLDYEHHIMEDTWRYRDS